MAAQTQEPWTNRLLICLLILNHLLMVSCGAALAVTAWLSLNLASLATELQAYGPVAVLLPLFAVGLFGLAVIVVATVCFRNSDRRQVLLYTYSALMAALLGAQALSCGWLAWRVANTIYDSSGSMAKTGFSYALSKASLGLLGNSELPDFRSYTLNGVVAVVWAACTGGAQLLAALLAAVCAYRLR